MLVCGSRNVHSARRGIHLTVQQAPLESVTSDSPFEKLLWDIMGPLPLSSSGNKYIAVITDLFTKWVEAFPLKSTETDILATLLVNEIICRYSVPSSLHSDEGAYLTSNLMAAVCKHLGIEQTRTTAYHPQGNGQVELFNRTSESMLAKVVSDGTITSHMFYLPIELLFMIQLDSLLFTSYLAVPLYSLLRGMPPMQTSKNIPSFLSSLHNSLHTSYATVRAHIALAHQLNKERYDKKRPFSPYSVGDLVWLHLPATKPGRTTSCFYSTASNTLISSVPSAGGYTSSSTDSHRPRRTCGPPACYDDYTSL